jgi:hypothetical protein
MVSLRTYLRHRTELIQHRAPHILHMQKALQQMNLQLHHVLSDITGVTGLQILRAIIAGERDPKVLASFRQPGCKADEATIIKALTGSWRQEYLFTLKQSLELFDFFTSQINACDAQIERQFAAIKPRWDAPDELPSLPPVKPNSRTKNKPAASTRQELFRILGVDVVTVEGISPRWPKPSSPKSAAICPSGRGSNTLPPGWGWLLTMIFPGARCCALEP